ncbi:hypothetical protein B9G39_25810 [Zooshikella ganghwensis]|uniref:HTH-like domain-containing protein n=1 Tax=Zooshikella ganghwensis TaxID=202772 RepID=A0A4P9VFP1_9GAMM|nr:hypothetical protein B9G39_26670 [Zooshikella ganghwensis]RDH41843.1 hypothetical protein B9G39_25810 [Zooshikella ganghwensis]
MKSRANKYPVRRLCKLLNVHPSGFYAWLKQPESKRTQEDRTLVSKIKRAWIESGGMHGYRNIHQDLIDLKVKCGRDRVYRLMKEKGLKAQRSAKAPRPYYGGKPDTVVQNGLA